MESVLLLVALVARLAVGALLLIAGVVKMRAPRSLFVEAIFSFNATSPRAALLVARTLPPLECALGAALVLGVAAVPAAMAAFALVAALTAAVERAIARGERFYCPCFGFTGGQVSAAQWKVALRNLALLLACMAAACWPDPLRLERAWGATFHVSSVALVAMAIVFLVLAVGLGLARLSRNPVPPPPTGALP